MHNDAAAAKKLLAEWGSRREGADSAFVVGLSGHLGAGKTSFAKLVAAELGVAETVASPTFVIMKSYEARSSGVAFSRLVHIDAYRLERREDLEALRFEEVAADPRALVLVEWPENAGLKRDDVDAWLAFEIRGGEHVVDERRAEG